MTDVPRKQPSPWNDERKALLRRGWDAGKPASKIADDLGPQFTKNMVIGKAHRMGLQRRPSPIRGAAGGK